MGSEVLVGGLGHRDLILWLFYASSSSKLWLFGGQRGESIVEFSETGDTIHVLELLFTIGDTCSEIVSQFNQVASHAQA